MTWRFKRAGNSATTPSSWEGTACSCGAVCTGGAITNGNGGSGPAPAAWEKVTAPTIAPRATAAPREFALKISRLNIVVPLFDYLSAPSAPFRRVVATTSTWQRFQDGCVGGLKWFRREQN